MTAFRLHPRPFPVGVREKGVAGDFRIEVFFEPANESLALGPVGKIKRKTVSGAYAFVSRR